MIVRYYKFVLRSFGSLSAKGKLSRNKTALNRRRTTDIHQLEEKGCLL